MDEVRVLIVEDADADFEILKWIISKQREEVTISRSVGFDDTLPKLNNTDELPDLVILDLNLVASSGFEILEHIRSDSTLKPMPVLISSTSMRDEDVERAYQMGANGYIVKKVDFRQFSKEWRITLDYWCDTAILPSTVGRVGH